MHDPSKCLVAPSPSTVTLGLVHPLGIPPVPPPPVPVAAPPVPVPVPAPPVPVVVVVLLLLLFAPLDVAPLDVAPVVVPADLPVVPLDPQPRKSAQVKHASARRIVSTSS
jgi:hypothetical protein